jgi:hypothetical protein
MNIPCLNLNNKSLYLSILLINTIFIFTPYYFFESGLPQPSFLVIFALSLLLYLFNIESFNYFIRLNSFGILLLFYIFLVNFTYAFYFKNISFILSTLQWVYCFFLLIAILLITNDKRLIFWIKLSAILGLLIIVIVYLAGYGEYNFYPRYQFYFNGPNQLGYFVLCIGTIYLSATNGKVDAPFFITYGLILFCIIITGGRSVYFGFIPLIVIFVFFARFKLKYILYLMIITIISVSSFYFFNFPLCSYSAKLNKNEIFKQCIFKNKNDVEIHPNIFGNSIDRIYVPIQIDKEIEKSSWYISAVKQLEVRGHLRIIEYPQYLLFGAGQGMDERFDSNNGYEVHSSFVGVFFYYGFFGIVLFFLFLWNLFKIKINLLLLMPLFIYGLFTQGLRSPYFWIALGFVAMMPKSLFCSAVDD